MATPPMKVMRIIWAALLGATLIYCLVAFMVAQKNAGRPFVDAVHDQRVQVVYAIAVITFAAAFFMRARDRERPTPVPVANIICWALFEAVTIYGLVLAFIALDWRLIVPPEMLSILGFVMTFPQQG